MWYKCYTLSFLPPSTVADKANHGSLYMLIMLKRTSINFQLPASRLMALQKECMEERARRLLAEQQVTAASPQATGTFSPFVLPPPPTHTPSDLTFKSPVAPPPPCNTPRRSTLLLLHQSLIVGYLPAVYQLPLMRSRMPSCVQALPTAVTFQLQR